MSCLSCWAQQGTRRRRLAVMWRPYSLLDFVLGPLRGQRQAESVESSTLVAHMPCLHTPACLVANFEAVSLIARPVSDVLLSLVCYLRAAQQMLGLPVYTTSAVPLTEPNTFHSTGAQCPSHPDPVCVGWLGSHRQPSGVSAKVARHRFVQGPAQWADRSQP